MITLLSIALLVTFYSQNFRSASLFFPSRMILAGKECCNVFLAAAIDLTFQSLPSEPAVSALVIPILSL